MSHTYRAFLYSSVAPAVLVAAMSAASAQTVVNQSVTNNAPVSNPVTGTNTIDLGGGGLGVGASASTGASGAVGSVSVTGINAQFVNPAGGFGDITQSPILNTSSAPITNNGAIIGGSGDALLGSSLSISARGAAASFSILGMGPVVFNAIGNVGGIFQGSAAIPTPASLRNEAPVTNTGEIAATGLALLGTGASASVSAVGGQASVSVTALDATAFIGGGLGGTTFSGIDQRLTSGFTAPVSNTVGVNGVSVGALSGDGASVSVGATGLSASVSFSYINTGNWTASQFNGGIFQDVLGRGSVTNVGSAGVNVGTISGDGASVRVGAIGAVASISLSTIGSTYTSIGGGMGQQFANVNQVATTLASSGVYNSGVITASGTAGLTGVGSSAVINATGAAVSVSVSSIKDTLTAPVSFGIGIPIFQSGQNNNSPITNFGQITLGSGNLANGAGAAVSAVGGQSVVSVSAVDTTAFTTPFLPGISQQAGNNVINGVGPSPVTNTLVDTGITVGNVTGHGASVSATATGALSSVSASIINTPAWTPLGANFIGQTAVNSDAVSNLATGTGNGIHVGNIAGTGASVRASATGASSSIAVSSIVSAPGVGIPVPMVSIGSINQAAFNNSGAITNNASIISTGTLTGLGSSAVISATAATVSTSIASINDTSNFGMVLLAGPITQSAVALAGGAVSNTGSITLGGGAMAAGSSASISAVGASAGVSFFVIK